MARRQASRPRAAARARGPGRGGAAAAGADAVAVPGVEVHAGAVRHDSTEMTATLQGRPVRAVLLDYGGTLAFFKRPDAALIGAYERISSRLLAGGHAAPTAQELLRDVHDRVEAEFLRHRQTGTLEEIDLVAVARDAYAAAGLTLTDDVLDDVLRIEQEAWWEGVQVNPDAATTLDVLRSAGVKVGACSNAPYRARSLHDQLGHVGLREHL